MKLEKAFWPITRVANGMVAIQNALVQRMILRTFERINIPATRMGTYYGGWWIPNQVVQNGKSWFVISCGLGHDISFDQQMVKFGIPVLGIESEEEFMSFLHGNGKIPQGMKVVHARVGLNSGGGLEIPDLMRFPATQNLDLKVVLKLDVEGSEFEVLKRVHHKDKMPEILMFECDYLSLIPFLAFFQRFRKAYEVIKVLNRLSDYGYLLYKKENWNFHFVRMGVMT